MPALPDGSSLGNIEDTIKKIKERTRRLNLVEASRLKNEEKLISESDRYPFLNLHVPNLDGATRVVQIECHELRHKQEGVNYVNRPKTA